MTSLTVHDPSMLLDGICTEIDQRLVDLAADRDWQAGARPRLARYRRDSEPMLADDPVGADSLRMLLGRTPALA